MKITKRILQAATPRVLALALALISASSMAQTVPVSSTDPVVQSVNDFKIELMSWLDIARKEYYGMADSAVAVDPAAVTKVNTAGDDADLSAWILKYSLPQISQALTQEGATSRVQALAAITASDTYLGPATTTADKDKQKASKAAGDTNFSSQVLLGPMVYVDKDNPTNSNRLVNRAINYVVFATGLGEAPTSIDYSALTDEQKKKLDTTELGRQYKIGLRGMVAARDLVVNNLFSMLAVRVEQPGLGEKAGMSKQNASLLEVEEFAATRRAKSEKWHQDMKKAAPVVLQQETLFVLAEIQQQLFKMQQQNESVLATLSITAAQNLRVAKLLQAQKELEVKQALGLAQQGSALPDDLAKQIQQERVEEELKKEAAAQTPQ